MADESVVAKARRLCFDSNALIYLLDRIDPYFQWLLPLFAAIQNGERVAVVSVVTETEAMVKPLREDDFDALQRIEDALSHPNVVVVGIDRTIARKAARVRAGLRLSLPDAIIVATAVETGCDLVIGNDRMCAQRLREVPYLYLDDMVSR